MCYLRNVRDQSGRVSEVFLRERDIANNADRHNSSDREHWNYMTKEESRYEWGKGEKPERKRLVESVSEWKILEIKKRAKKDKPLRTDPTV